MDTTKTICLLNDSFPPLIDGVANAVCNYARVINQTSYHSAVITPSHPQADDGKYPYSVIRYPSIDLRKKTGYMAGIPFSPDVAKALQGKEIALLHTHCPIVSTMMGRELRQIYDAPLVLTYHTKFDVDIANILKSKLLRSGSEWALLENINACDEVWAVSQGAADNLHSLGYEGECFVMSNGVDIPREIVSADYMHSVVDEYDLPAGVPIFLFVGRIMWYKGLKIIIEALAMMNRAGKQFRMVFVGSGADFDEVREYAASCQIDRCCIFTGAIHDRNALRAWYCRADLFLFPSTFDTNGLVVREAAACSLGSVLIRNSCASEGVTDGRNGILIEENAQSLFSCLMNIADHPEYMASIGQNASEELYLSWDDAVSRAMERYEIIIERHRSGYYPTRNKPIEDVFKANGILMEDLALLQNARQILRENLKEAIHSNPPKKLHESIHNHIHEIF